MAFIFPPDTTRCVLAPLMVEPMTDESGQPRTTKDGVPRWAVQTLVTAQPDSETDRQPRPELIRISVASHTEPKFTVAQPATFDDLQQRAWEMNGRSGVSFSASGIRHAKPGSREE